MPAQTTDWQDVVFRLGPFQVVELLDQVMLQVRPEPDDGEGPILMIGKDPELVEEDGRYFLAFTRFFSTGDWSPYRVCTTRIVRARTGPSLETRLRRRGSTARCAPAPGRPPSP